MLSLSQGMWENIYVSLGFFILDVGLIVLVLPFALNEVEKRKWAPMRAEIIDQLVAIRTKSFLTFAYFLSQAFAIYLENMTQESDRKLPEFSKWTDELRKWEHETREFVDLLSPAMQPGMASPLMELLKVPRSIASLLHRFVDDAAVYVEQAGVPVPARLGDHISTGAQARQRLLGIGFGLRALAQDTRLNVSELITNASLPRGMRKPRYDALDDLELAEEHLFHATEGFVEIFVHSPVGGPGFRRCSSLEEVFAHCHGREPWIAIGCLVEKAFFDELLKRHGKLLHDEGIMAFRDYLSLHELPDM